MRAGICYVLHGTCSFRFGSQEAIEIREGQFATLPEGTYHFRVLGEAPVELIMVWELPEDFRSPA
ncbi:hypothetical protein BE04_25300 [Sorangium cellulosum]|uniref:(S)-ureidoglycine aminohydrolase cupin domain-containing protein n=2 Tax=Sorangium cellulosum TaxID=56 RepID=A0A150PF69_SORCE|nr:hypothetical protein SCE1572_36035 [Sorangium cellulosum So0157-2]KYF54148.1 hypothetical protein BE04_25300 [Sorangium cellulosum]